MRFLMQSFDFHSVYEQKKKTNEKITDWTK